MTTVHWGTFTLDTPHWNALKYIDPLMRQNREAPYEQFDAGDDNDYQISVIACGADSQLAEFLRTGRQNPQPRVREQFDQLPVRVANHRRLLGHCRFDDRSAETVDHRQHRGQVGH